MASSPINLYINLYINSQMHCLVSAASFLPQVRDDLCRHADLPVAVSVLGLGGMLCLLLLDCSSSSPNVTLQNHLEQREVDVDQTLCQITASCSIQSNTTTENRKDSKVCAIKMPQVWKILYPQVARRQ